MSDLLSTFANFGRCFFIKSFVSRPQNFCASALQVGFMEPGDQPPGGGRGITRQTYLAETWSWSGSAAAGTITVWAANGLFLSR
ncbi:MAG: hypothetical protein JXA13_03430, partial [Anaerolineales bacterium]|nr:hypothetical protein [Anaerolineales bacterium]